MKRILQILRQHKKRIAVSVIFIIVGLGIGVGVGVLQKQGGLMAPAVSPLKNPNITPLATGFTPTAGGVMSGKQILYAQVAGNADAPVTEVFSANSDGTNIVQRLKITALVKEITPLSIDSYILIADLGYLDRGKRIIAIKNGKDSEVLTASEGYLIDSYILSPDKKKLVVWEVENVSEPKTNHFWLVDLAGGKPTLLLTDATGEQTKYPLFWSQATNRIYFDTYSVNKGGIHKGMFSAKPDGTDLQAEVFFDSEYSSTPVLSPDGTKAVLTTFNSATNVQLPGTSVTNGIFRPAIRNPNEIRTIDLAAHTSQVLVSEAGKLYYDTTWAVGGKTIVYRIAQTDGTTMTPVGFGMVDAGTKMASNFFDNPNGVFVPIPGSDKYLFAMRSQAVDSLGGPGIYSPLVRSVYTFNPQTRIMKKILTDEPIQILAII